MGTMVSRVPGFFGRFGTAARKNVGTAAGQLVMLDSSAKLPAVDGSNLTGISAGGSSFPAGTLMLFQQTSAPTGWTKQTTHNDKALRVVSGSASSGGTNAFSTVFGLTATSNYTLTISDVPAHTHTVASPTPSAATGVGSVTLRGGDSSGGGFTVTTDSKGGGGGHSHGIDLRVQYVDLIIASKN